MIQPEGAAVRPRILAPESGAALPLEEEILRLLEERATGLVQIVGPCGSGKTTALRHLATMLPPDAPAVLLDQPLPGEVPEAETQALVIYTTRTARSGPHLATLRLAPWGDDDLIEYLLSLHRDRCRSVMSRVRPSDRALLAGIPDLWQTALEQLVADDEPRSARHALYRHLQGLLPDTDVLERSRSACLNAMTAAEQRWARVLEQLDRLSQVPGLVRVLRHEPVQVLLAADRVAADLSSEADCDFLAVRLPRELITLAAAGLDDFPRASARLHRFLGGPAWSHAMAASLLHATGHGWRPQPGQVPVLKGAYLEGAVWPEVRLRGVALSEADLTGADLRGADLSQAVARKAGLSCVVLTGASLREFDAAGADLSGADLSHADARGARFDEANLEAACLEEASLTRASLVGSVLTGATFVAADLFQARLVGARLEGSDFTSASLRGARLSGLALREACFRGADFEGAVLEGCDLEGMDLPGVNFREADLTGALLTGSRMPKADFADACLKQAGLADVDWEGACLRGADLRGASFHMGSSRSGLVCSPIACEGSKTGFYTDDFEEQHYKAPEEIRKANLCGADLRGARLDETDFYLVDLRGARIDIIWLEHLRRCGAILQDRP
jgi:uncharacterized protein YjbI with pentapeptide repeats